MPRLHIDYDALKEFLTQQRSDYRGRTSISKCDHVVRLALLNARLTKIIDCLRFRYDAISTYMNMINLRAGPIKLLATIRVDGFTDRSAALLYTYLIELYAILNQLTILESLDESSIEYEEIDYS